MKIRRVRQVILILTAVAVVLTVGTVATVKNLDKEEQQETAQVEHTHPPVEVVEKVEETPVVVENSVESVQNSAPPELTYTEEQLEILAIIIYQEAGGDACSDDTHLKVGSVFLNRVAHPNFPNTFEEVATAERQYGRLHWTGIKWPDRAENAGEAHAVERAYRLAEQLLTDGSILPANVIWQAEFEQGDGTYCYQDGLYFCYSGVIE